jgi:hypothetical protein
VARCEVCDVFVDPGDDVMGAVTDRLKLLAEGVGLKLTGVRDERRRGIRLD